MEKTYPNMPRSHNKQSDTEYDLIDLVSRAFSNKKLLAALVIVGFVTSTIYCYFIENQYTSFAILAPSIQENSSIISSLSDSLSGIGNLAGINLSSSDSEKDKAITILTSRNNVHDFIIRNNLMREIFHRRWDPNLSTWREPSILQKAKIRFDESYNSLTPSRSNYAPDIDSAYRKFTEEFLSVKTDKKTGFIHLAITTYTPKLSQSILNKFIIESNERIRDIKIRDLQKNNEYLQEKIEETKVAYIQTVLNDLIRTNIQNIMLTETKDEYAFEILEPPTLPERHSQPNRPMMIAGFTFICLLFGLVISIWLSKKKDR